jgi:valyl-tRNA synthetase
VTVATVRPPTILADVAVAVNPADARYASLVGGEAIVPIVERRVPIIADERVETDFGPARSRSRRVTTRSTSRSAGSTASPSRW